jgi:hypothetical protein
MKTIFKKKKNKGLVGHFTTILPYEMVGHFGRTILLT